MGLIFSLVGINWLFLEGWCGLHVTFVPMLLLGWLIGRALRVSGEQLPWHFGLIAAGDTLVVCLILDFCSAGSTYFTQTGYVEDVGLLTTLALFPAHWRFTHLLFYGLACAIAYRASYDRVPWKKSPPPADSPETIADYEKRITTLSGTVQVPPKRGMSQKMLAALILAGLLPVAIIALLPRCRPSVGQLALSPGGDVLAVDWEQFNGKLVWFDLPHDQSIQSQNSADAHITWSPDGNQLAGLSNYASSNELSARAYIHVGERLGSSSKTALEEPRRQFGCLAYSPDGKIVASGCADGDVLLWTPRWFRPLGRLPNKSAVTSLVFSPTTGRLAAGLSNGKITLWDLANPQALWTCQAQKNKVHQLLFSPKEDVLFSTSAREGVVHAWNGHDGSEKQSYPVPMNWITNIALAPDGQTLAVAGGYFHQPGEVRLFDMATAQLKQVLTVDTNTVAAVAFAADGRTLFAGTRPPINPLFGPFRGQVQRWDLATGQQLAPLE